MATTASPNRTHRVNHPSGGKVVPFGYFGGNPECDIIADDFPGLARQLGLA